jgi:hypothetical protein
MECVTELFNVVWLLVGVSGALIGLGSTKSLFSCRTRSETPAIAE